MFYSMSFTVQDEDTVLLLDGTLREILIDEIYILLGRKNVITFLEENINESFILYRKLTGGSSKLYITHLEFKKGQLYINTKTGKRYICIGVDNYTNEALFREQRSFKSKIKHSKNQMEWCIPLRLKD